MTSTDTQAPEFGETETIKVADLAPGDWVQTFPAQHGIRGLAIGSGIKTLGPSVRGWYTQSRRRGPKMPLAASRITFLMCPSVLDIPDTCDIIVRRKLA